MQKLFVLFVAAVFAVVGSLSVAHAKSSGRVKGYTKKNGTYVAPHNKTTPDKSKHNNYGSKGNVNPYTGKQGIKDPNKP